LRSNASSRHDVAGTADEESLRSCLARIAVLIVSISTISRAARIGLTSSMTRSGREIAAGSFGQPVA
jgi:hypothetical protein